MQRIIFKYFHNINFIYDLLYELFILKQGLGSEFIADVLRKMQEEINPPTSYGFLLISGKLTKGFSLRIVASVVSTCAPAAALISVNS